MHVELTHNSPQVKEAASALTRLIIAIAGGIEIRSAIQHYASDWIQKPELEWWSRLDDRRVVGGHLSPACYLPESFTAALFLVWKYADDFTGGVLANARCGGDNCHRGAVVGSLLGAANGVPERWLNGLRYCSGPAHIDSSGPSDLPETPLRIPV